MSTLTVVLRFSTNVKGDLLRNHTTAIGADMELVELSPSLLLRVLPCLSRGMKETWLPLAGLQGKGLESQLGTLVIP